MIKYLEYLQNCNDLSCNCSTKLNIIIRWLINQEIEMIQNNNWNTIIIIKKKMFIS